MPAPRTGSAPEHRHDPPEVAPDLDVVLDAVAPRLRDLRSRRQLTLAEVAGATGIGVSTLSRLESGKRRPSLDLLLPLARVYQVPLDDLVGAPNSGDPRIHPRPQRRGEQVFIPLTRRPGGVQAYKVIFPGHTGGTAPPVGGAHEGYEWVYVLAGTLRLELGGVVTVLTEGEAAEFDTRTHHRIRSNDERTVEVLMLFSPQGEQIHVRGSA